MSELLSQLQQLGDGEIDDLSIAHDASEEIVALRLRVAELEDRCTEQSTAVQGEPVGFCEDTALSLAERTFGSEVDEQLAEDVIQYARRLHDLYAAAQPAGQQPINPDLAFDASVHLTNWLNMNWCECEGAHTCGYNEVKRTRDALLEAAEQRPVEQQPAPDVSGLVEALREGRRAIGDHHAPNDCYATGPVTGDSFRDLVQCPACSFIAMHDAILAGDRKGGEV